MSAAEDRPKKRAVALSYDRERDAAPNLSAKGRGYVAERILALAEQNDVPVRREPDLVSLLEPIDLGEDIPIEAYEAVAEILAFLYRCTKRRL